MLYSVHALRHLRILIGNNIRHIRARRNITLSAVAAETGVSETLLDRYELGRHEVDLNTLFKIACVLDVTPHDLIPRT